MEWNNSALFIIFLMFLVPVLVIYTLLKLLFKYSPLLGTALKKAKQERFTLYMFMETGLFLLALLLTFVLLLLFNAINGGRGLLG